MQQALIKAGFGWGDLITYIPATAAFLFFGFVLVGVLIRKDEASRAQVSTKRAPSPWGISSAASTAHPAAKVGLDAEHHVTGMTTAIMSLFHCMSMPIITINRRRVSRIS